MYSQTRNPETTVGFCSLIFSLYVARTHGKFNHSATHAVYFIACFSMQLIAEFDRVVEQQNASFLAAKLRWLELVPRILEIARSEGNECIAHWLHPRSEASDEGLSRRTMYR